MTIMEIHGFTENGSIDATIAGVRMTVPNDPSNRHRQMIAEWEAKGNTIPAYVPPPVEPAPLGLHQVACARLQVEGWDITGIERSQGVSMAFMLDENTAWVFFSETQPDTNYIVMPADDVTKYPDYIEVVRPGISELSLLVFRVQ